MKSIFIICGPTASGKTTLADSMERNGYFNAGEFYAISDELIISAKRRLNQAVENHANVVAECFDMKLANMLSSVATERGDCAVSIVSIDRI